MNKKISATFIVVMGSLLASCSTSNRYVEVTDYYAQKQPKNIQINYKPSINIIAKDSDLIKYIDEAENKNFKLNNSQFSVLNLYIESSIVEDQIESPSINLVGILKEETKKYNYKVSFKLVDTKGNILLEGSSIGISDEKSKFISKTPTKASDSAIKDAALQIVKEVNSNISNIPIEFKIISVSDNSVYISINDNIRLSNEDIFLVNELNGTALSLNQVISNTHTKIAELKIITGVFPKVGMTVNLQK